MVAVITSTIDGLGFNPFSAIKSGVKAVARVATNPNVQRVATAAAGSYAPTQYAQAQQVVSRAQTILRPPGGASGTYAPAAGPEEVVPDTQRRKGGNGMLTLAAIGGGLVLVFLLTRSR